MESVDGWLLEVGGLRGDTGTEFRSGAIAYQRLIIRESVGIEGVGLRKGCLGQVRVKEQQ
jgi:hypothetical protein